MRYQAYEPGRLYALTTHKWKFERIMEFVRKAPGGYLIFALPAVDAPINANMDIEVGLKPDQILKARRVDVNQNGEEVLLP